MRGRCDHERRLARQARNALASMLADARYVELVNVTRGKYFRLVATVLADGIDVSRALVAHRLARPYDGHSPRQGWC